MIDLVAEDSFSADNPRVWERDQSVITGCQVCLDTDSILYTNTSPQTAHRDQINNYAPGKLLRANKLNIKLQLRLISLI